MNVFRNQNPLDALKFEIDKVGRKYRVSRNFTLGELASKDGANIVFLHPALILGIQVLRDYTGKKAIVKSCYRSPSHNKKVKGAKNSTHVKGMGIDLVMEEMTPMEVASLAHDMGFGGIKAYTTFTHLDVGEPRTW